MNVLQSIDSFLSKTLQSLGPTDARRAEFEKQLKALQGIEKNTADISSHTAATARGVNGMEDRVIGRAIANLVQDTSLGAVSVQ
jgi:hypothetical protein